MDSNHLSKELVANPTLWQLAVEVCPTSLEVTLRSKIEDNSFIYRSIPFNSGASNVVAELENAVYDNPLLLSDFASVDVLIDTCRFMFVPAELTDADVQSRMVNEMWPDAENAECISDDLHQCGARILTVADPALLNFLQRTFNNPRISHRLAPLCRYFSARSRMGNTGKMYVHLRPESVDIVMFSRTGLKFANTIAVSSVADVAYYVLATARMAQMSVSTDEIFVSGEQKLREGLMPILREYASYVMPLIFPAELYKSGRQSIDSPFELAVIPLCE